MTAKRAIGLFVAVTVLIGGYGLSRPLGRTALADPPPPPPPPPGEQPYLPPAPVPVVAPAPANQPDVLTRGPVNEAFAEPIELDPQPGLIVPNQPPPNIDEVPPADRPAGGNFVWIPGYWGWDNDRRDFVWVSACWRAAPPNMYWVPGYWTAVPAGGPPGGVNVNVPGVGVHVGGGVDVHVWPGVNVHVGGNPPPPPPPGLAGGWQWVPGFWAATPAAGAAQEMEYLPTPPADFDTQPPGPPPAPNMTWVPGCWYWQDGQYVRRPGYWLAEQPDWMWIPAHFRWTPRGCVFAGGYWDYPLLRRGVLFAPAYFPPAVYAQPGYSYTPSIAVDLGGLMANLFVYPRYGHYCFGDYYDPSYAQAGIYPPFESDQLHTWYDPIYAHHRWQASQTDKQWDEHQRQDYSRRQADKTLRPPSTYRETEARAAKVPEADRRNFQLARPLPTFATDKTSPMKFEQLNKADQQKFASQAKDVHKFSDERTKWEAPAKVEPKAGLPPAEVHAIKQPERVKIPPPPIMGTRAEPGKVEGGGPPGRPGDEGKREEKKP